MKMAGACLAKRTVINGGAEALFKFGFAQNLGVPISERVPFILPLAQGIQLRRFWNCMQIAPFEIAIDIVFGDPLDDQLFGFLGNREAFERIFLSKLVFDALLAG